ncbi:hypothetical protein EVA_04237 [gut metagenome]|uniref:Uncharacterized protein n=1 Tax=gut metagenome TaxID=749906 RepID=J9H2B9_9ZZZZ
MDVIMTQTLHIIGNTDKMPELHFIGNGICSFYQKYSYRSSDPDITLSVFCNETHFSTLALRIMFQPVAMT